MATVTFDTLDATRRLRDAGFDEKQAETVVRVLSDAQDALATKNDIDSLRQHIEARFDKLYWMVGFAIALLASIAVKQFS